MLTKKFDSPGQTATMRVSDYIAARLVQHGIRHVFMVTGGGAMHLNDAFGREPALKVVATHHEQAAAMAAESYFRLSGRLAALNVTTGPGCLNALNGVFGAYVDSLGMIVISGQVKRETIARNYPLALRQLGDQEVDIVTMVRPIVKYAALVTEPGRVREIVDKALFLAGSGRPGPTWIDVPGDIQGALIDPSALKGFDPLTGLAELENDPDVSPNTLGELSPERDAALDGAVEEIIARLSAAKRPVILAGAGIRISGMHREFVKLIETLGIPVVCGWNAYDALSNDHPSYAGRPSTVGDRAGNFTVQNADVLLVLGSRLNIRQVSYNYESFARFAWKAMVDIDPAELAKPTLDIDLPVHADLRDFIPAMLRRLGEYRPKELHGEYLAWCRERVQEYPVVLPEYWRDNLINPYCFMNTLFRHLRVDDVVVTGDGTASVTSQQAGALRVNQRLYSNSGCASMGYDLPAAIGAYFASVGGRIVCITGDGSIMMNLQELQTIVGLNLPIKIFVLNNQGYHSIRQTQQAYFPDNEVGVGPDSGLTFPDFVRLAGGFGIPADRFDAVKALDSELDRILDMDGPVICEIMLDLGQGFSPKLASRKLADGTMISSPLEDLAPFLSREELARNMIAESEG